MLRLGWSLTLLAACSFSAPLAGTPGDDAPDAGPTPDGTGDPDAPAVCTAGFLDLCDQPDPTEPLVLAGTLNTDGDPRCRFVTQASGPQVCVVMGTSVTIEADTTLEVTGSRPFAIAALGDVQLAGELDVSSRRGGRTGPGIQACMPARAPENDGGGAGGGAGGSLAAAGGAGGTGDTDNSIGPDGTALGGLPAETLTTITVLRGGCRGGKGGNESGPGGNEGGAGGHGGGAVYVAARGRIVVTGAIRATGAGGTGGGAQAGGGGGGSGGVVILEAPQLVLDGDISANGGGGGEGGANVGQNQVAGVSGSDGGYGTTAAAGGEGNDDRFGFGGDGGAWMTSTGEAGRDSAVAGGGGGGAVGAIRVLGQRQGSGLVTPPAP